MGQALAGDAIGVIAVNQRPTDAPKRVIPFAPAEKEPARNDADPMDRSGDAIIALLEKAARVADEDCRRAMDLAHKLSLQLRAAEDRASQLQAHVDYFQDRAMRAENWLARIHKEIDQKFLQLKAGKGSQEVGRDRA
jgi:hypothetical protein